MQTIRSFLFGVNVIIALLFLFIGLFLLNKKQRKKMEVVLDKIESVLSDFKEELVTIEDKILMAEMEVCQDDYKEGTNPDLSVTCRICGENTPRGKYYCRIDGEKDSSMDYMFICKDCYRILPEDKEELALIKREG